MTGFRIASLLLAFVLLAGAPCAALHAVYLDVTIGKAGDATVTFEYTLSPLEQLLSFLGAIRPGRDLGTVLGAATGGKVGQVRESGGSASFPVDGFASVTGASPNATYRTPVLNLSWAEAGWRTSLIAPLLEPDFSPGLAVIRFPDAYSVTFHDLLVIPNTTHTL